MPRPPSWLLHPSAGPAAGGGGAAAQETVRARGPHPVAVPVQRRGEHMMSCRWLPRLGHAMFMRRVAVRASLCLCVLVCACVCLCVLVCVEGHRTLPPRRGLCPPPMIEDASSKKLRRDCGASSGQSSASTAFAMFICTWRRKCGHTHPTSSRYRVGSANLMVAVIVRPQSPKLGPNHNRQRLCD